MSLALLGPEECGKVASIEGTGVMRSTIRCREIVDLLADYLDGSLPVETAKSLEAHLEGCTPCIAFVNTYRGTVNAVRRLHETEIPPELRDRLITFLEKQNRKRS